MDLDPVIVDAAEQNPHNPMDVQYHTEMPIKHHNIISQITFESILWKIWQSKHLFIVYSNTITAINEKVHSQHSPQRKIQIYYYHFLLNPLGMMT